MSFSEDKILLLLEDVKDPEIPVLSLVDLGIIRKVMILDERIEVNITPTFVGCPALEMMKSNIVDRLKEAGAKEVKVTVSFDRPWSSDDISEKGKRALKAFGLAPPPHALITDLEVLEHAECPRCGGRDTEMKSLFGATLCRSMHYCNKCKEAFEQFKPV